MKANKDPKIEIKEIDKDAYHIEFTRRIKDDTGKYPDIKKRVQIYSPNEYTGLLDWVKKFGLDAMNDDEMRVVHDPVLQAETEAEAVKKAEAKAKIAAKKTNTTPK